MKMIKKSFTLGQKVWFEPDDKRDKGFYTTITKVGRLYYTIYQWNIKFDKDTLCHCEYPHGRLYISAQEAKDAEHAIQMFLKLRNNYSIKPTLQQMQEIYEILGLEYKK